MVASVLVFLPPSSPEVILIKALYIRESTQEDCWRAVVAVCFLGGHSLSLTPQLSYIVISRGHSRWCPAYVLSEQALLNTAEVTLQQCSTVSLLDGSPPMI